MDGFLNVLKPPGMTSHDIISFLRKNLNIKKVGHLGTLDPGAAGVLPICIGKATKLAQYVVSQTKMYRAEITFGFSTDSIDKFGHITSVTPVKVLEQYKMLEIENAFKGDILQIPPIYSAKKVDGKRLYQYAREGKTIDIKPSLVTIYDINVISYEAPYKIMFDVKCSKGTYVRALVRDICDYLNISGYMSMLIRLSVGSFTLENSFTLEEIVDGKYKIMKMDDVITFPDVCLNNDDYHKIVHGNPVKNRYIDTDNEFIKLYSPEHSFVGVGKVADDRIYVERLLFGADG
ncbi:MULTISPECIES: tRNA pseudouridine(55) synthase TruB [Thermoanaerobacterium]|uniref:tRNA pseudouridine synthase B n=2 Tax=Thermoanaerobacterium TaxID=28895 RepID=W9E9H3_9THEO|nr:MULTISPECIES: tRNA pseudouridine(55) synthase TruB [Thermoanaerobacterium]AFK86835.1 tRNA pseudouridine synthase B [Thermoanaerobacterium saccharolyticum JW/SL-YS485]ETO38547.1 tRNA pseudouridine synthase B [Thermoanaerobacterium aotearoense SCUT27]